MDLPVNALTWLAAALPLAALVYLLVQARWPTVRAAAVGVGVAAVVAALLYKAPAALLVGEAAKGIWNSLSIIAVILAAIFVYEISRATEGFGAIQRDLQRLAPNQLLQVMILGRCFSSFLQGPSGFGVPVAVTSPLLIGIGVKPFWAVLVPLMAHSWANTFGTLALGWEALVAQTGLTGQLYLDTAWWTGVFTGIICLITGVALCWYYDGWRGLRLGWPAVIILTAIQAGGQLVLTQVNTTLCAVIPTAVALAVSFLLGKMKRYSQPDDISKNRMFEASPTPPPVKEGMGLHRALLPYYLLTVISIVILLFPPVRNVLQRWQTGFAFPASQTGYGFANPAVERFAPIAWLTHPGFFLLVAGLLSCVYFYAKGFMNARQMREISANTVRRARPAAVAVALLLAMSRVMSGSGQIDVLAQGVAWATGDFYAALAPAVGTLGAFMSSSNVSSNILFGQFQLSMAELTGSQVVIILAAQTSGGAAGAMFAPSNVLLGATTAGVVGQEGAIIKRLFAIAAVVAVLLGILAMAMA